MSARARGRARLWGALLASALLLGAGGARTAEAGTPGRTTLHADAAGALNPEGLLLGVGGYRRWTLAGDPGDPLSTYLQIGAGAGLSPAYATGRVHAEWVPHPALQLRAQYAWSRYFGARRALLSFPSGDAGFGRRELEALEGEEEAAWGQRLLLRPVLRLKLGPVILRNATDFAFCRFGGRGPYFLEWEYDTLVKDRDWVIADGLQAVVKAWGGAGAAALYAGPYFEVAHAVAAGITQERAGLLAGWVPRDRLGKLARPRAYLQAGVHLRDPNREGEPYVVIGVGFDVDLD